MRFTPLAALVSVLAVATCTPVERGAVAPPSGPAFAHVQDLDGTPDMIVDAKTLATSWVVYDQELKESFCSIEEANLAPGKYRLLRFTVVTPNIGDADIYIGDVRDRKSTRLNSSHGYISYAVFCLKKKNKNS